MRQGATKAEPGDAPERKRGEGVNCEREGEAPPAEIERQTSAQIAHSLEDREAQPPDAITPQDQASERTEAEGDLAYGREPIGGEKAADLLQGEWVLRGVGSGTRSAFEQALKGVGIRPEKLGIALELPSNEAVRAAVEAGLGATATSASVAASSWRPACFARSGSSCRIASFMS